MAKMTVKEKAVYYEMLGMVIEEVERIRDCYAIVQYDEYGSIAEDEDGRALTKVPTKEDDEYRFSRYHALCGILEKLEEM